MIRQEKGRWVLRTSDGSRVLGTHGSHAGALAQERAIHVRQRMSKISFDKTARAATLEGLARAAKPMLRRPSIGTNPAVKAALEEAVEAALRKYTGKKREKETPKLVRRAPMPKHAGIADMPVPESLLYEAASGDPQSAAELKRLEEAHARKVYGMGGLGPMRSVMGRSLLGRTRTAGATTETERKLLESRPELSQLSAAAQPEETYPVSRALTTPGLVAIPAAGAGGLLARLIAQAAGASGATRELATAAGVGLGGVAGATAAYGLRQRHAKQMGRWMHDQDTAERRAIRRAMQEQVGAPESPSPEEMKLSSVNLPELIPHFLSSLGMDKEGKWLARIFGRAADAGVAGGMHGAESGAMGIARGAETALTRGAEAAMARGLESGVARGTEQAAARGLERSLESGIARGTREGMIAGTNIGAPERAGEALSEDERRTLGETEGSAEPMVSPEALAASIGVSIPEAAHPSFVPAMTPLAPLAGPFFNPTPPTPR